VAHYALNCLRKQVPVLTDNELFSSLETCTPHARHYNAARMNKPVNRAVFLDRDGTIMEDASYFGDVDRAIIISSAPAALKRLHTAGYRLFVVTNQSGVARGYFTREAIEQIHTFLDDQFAALGVRFDRYYVCPHHPEDHCDCRKPKPKFLQEAIHEYRLEPARCFMIGDRPTDIQAGINAGVQTILVLTGAGQETLAKGNVSPNYVADDLRTAADWILTQRQ
jgi:D-glycero-D-manno-heptose 1,7-bisphosphate phosphatase